MYNCQAKIWKLFVIWLSLLVGIQGYWFWFDLVDEIWSIFQKQYNIGHSDSYLQDPYISTYTKDPYAEALKNVEDMSMQVKISWAEYVENALASKQCSSLSQKKIWAILYFFVPDFRTELARTMKKNLWDTSSKKYMVSKNTIYDYCREYYYCVGNWSTQTFKEKITSYSPADILSNCKEFFISNYKQWQEGQQRQQDVETAQVGADKYWNATTDDSPFDIMLDMWTIGKLLYTEVEQPLTPVFYNLPMFSNSKKSLQNREKNGSSNNNSKNNSSNNQGNWWNSGNWSSSPSTDKTVDEGNGNLWSEWNAGGGNSWWGWSSSVNPDPLPLDGWSEWFSMEWWYDRLLEWLWAYTLIQDDSIYYWSLCKDREEESVEPEPSLTYQENSPWKDVFIGDEDVQSQFSRLPTQVYEEIISYLKSSVDDYVGIPDDKKEEILAGAWDKNEYSDNPSPEQIDSIADEIKNCFKKCEWLRIDQQASCMMMCACGEIESPIFDPEKTPWLWPIFTIRFCTVPWMDTRFSIWWKRVVSIQEWINEIYWVVDKLSREWKLWIWTQQNNFLDSSTKKMKVVDSIAFSLWIEFVDISWKSSEKHSDQFKEKEINKENATMQELFHISNNLENPVLKNNNRLIDDGKVVSEDFGSLVNADWAREDREKMKVSYESIVSLSGSAMTDRYIDLTSMVSEWLDKQWALWIVNNDYIMELDKYARLLKAKPKIN